MSFGHLQKKSGMTGHFTCSIISSNRRVVKDGMPTGILASPSHGGARQRSSGDRQETTMRNKKNRRLNVNGSRAATHLYVTDLVNDSEEILDFTCELAERNGARLQVLHIVDPEHTPSMPDAQMGIQYRLEALARRLKHL